MASNVKVTVSDGIQDDVLPASAPTEPTKPGILETRQKHNQMRDEYTAARDQGASDTDEGPMDLMQMAAKMMQSEPLDDLEQELPDGRVIQMAVPSRSQTLVVERMLARDSELSMSQSARMYIMATMHVTRIDEEAIKMPNNISEVYAIQDKLGDRGLAAVLILYNKHFMSAPNLALTKKNLRKC